MKTLTGIFSKIKRNYFVGVGPAPEPLQEKSRMTLEAPAEAQIGLPWSSEPVWRTEVTHQRIM